MWGEGVWEHAPDGEFLKSGPLKMHFCIQVADVDLDAVVQYFQMQQQLYERLMLTLRLTI